VDEFYTVEIEPEVRDWLERKICEAEHGPAHREFVRVVEEGELGS
jgi:hypothetical protein